MTPLMAIFARTGRAASLADKLRLERDVAVLEAMAQAVRDRGEHLTPEEQQALARRRVELQRGTT